jgi:hypothetical protein
MAHCCVSFPVLSRAKLGPAKTSTLALLTLALLTLALLGCSGESKQPVVNANSTPTPASSSANKPREYSEEDGAWAKFHSKRFQITIPLPDGKAWKIDDHKAPELVATHATTESELHVLATNEEDLMNRQRCEERAKKLGWLPAKEGALSTMTDDVYVSQDGYDTRLWVALEAARPGGGVQGHIFMFGAYIRKCLLVHLSTSVPSAKDEEVIAKRLAIAETRIIKKISVAPLRTTDDAQVPRDKPDIRR